MIFTHTIGVHTVVLHLQLTKNTAASIVRRYRPRQTIDRILASLQPQAKPYKIKFTTDLSYQFYFYACKFDDGGRIGEAMGIKVQIAPYEMATGCPRTADLYDFGISTYQLLQNGFRELITHYFDDDISTCLRDWHVVYIEYSLNLYVDNKALVLKMLDKSAKSAKSRTYRHDNVVTGSRKSNESGKGRAMTDYDKEEQMQIVYDIDDEDYKFIRMELQLHRDAIYRLRRKYNISNCLYDLLNRQIAVQELAIEYRRTYSVGDYFSKRAAKKALAVTDYSKRVQYNLLQFMGDMATKKSVKTGKRQSKSQKDTSYSVNMLNSRIRQFNDVFIAPIPIPRDDKVPYLPNPIPDEFLTDPEKIRRLLYRIQWGVS